MSADNGIYVLETPATNGEGYEYRIVHAQAIENIYWNTDVNDYDPEGRINPKQVKEYFGDAEVHIDREAALKKAFDMADEITADPDFPILEYGVSVIKYDNIFPI